MPFDPRRHDRRSIRLPGHDYSRAGGYVITICTVDRALLFGSVVDATMRLNSAGQVVQGGWLEIPEHFPRVRLDEFLVMPTHLHGTIWLMGEDTSMGAKDFSPLHPTLSCREPRSE